MMLENISINLQQIVEKINNAISDVDYASSYSRSSATSSYCSYAKRSLEEVKEELMSISEKSDNFAEIVQTSIDKIDNAISNISYADSYSRSSASSSYCGYACRSLRGVQKELKQVILNFDQNKEQVSEETLERVQ